MTAMTREYCTSVNKGGIQCFHPKGHKWDKHEGMIVINGQGMATAFWYDDEKEKEVMPSD